MIAIAGLTKTYGRRVVVDDASFTCAQGTITGFLGPNGAGKSTTLKMLLDLVDPTRGSATISGLRYRDLPQPVPDRGASLDPDGLHPGRTVLETLRLAARIIGTPPTRVEEVLVEIGLAGERRKTVRACSLGMRQRLSIGVALLGEPEYLILDEPVNGLDPDGIALDPRTSATGGPCGSHGPALQPHPPGGGVDRRYPRDHESRPGRGPRDGGGPGRVEGWVAGRSHGSTQTAAGADGGGITHYDEGTDVYAAATPEQIGQLALDHRIVVTKLVAASTDRIERLYFNSTGRELAAAGRRD